MLCRQKPMSPCTGDTERRVAKAQAQQVSCLNNIKQITYSGMMYMHESGTCLPYNPLVNNKSYDPTILGELWCDVVTNYGAKGPIAICPSTHLPLSTNIDSAGTADMPWVFQENLLSKSFAVWSYGANAWMFDYIKGSNAAPTGPTGGTSILTNRQTFVAKKPSDVQNPSQTPLIFDAWWGWAEPLETSFAAIDLYSAYSGTHPSSGMSGCTILRHGGPTASMSSPHSPGQVLPGAINLSCMDGHAATVPLPQLWSYYWHLNWNPALVNKSP
jgi:hypothetical protein